jgi:hypothetical protein
MADFIDRYRRKVNAISAAENKISDMIELSTSKAEVFVEKLNRTIPMIFITNDKESADEVIIYTYTSDNIQTGDYIRYFNKDHLVYKKINNVKRENYIDSYNAIACNVEFTHNGSTVKGYFKGTLRNVTTDEQNLVGRLGVWVNTEALLVVPNTVSIKYNQELKIGSETYRVMRFDTNTNEGISYFGIELTTSLNTDRISVNETEDGPVVEDFYRAGSEYEVQTEGGFVQFDSKVQITLRTAALVKFIVPLGITQLSVTVKEEGEPKTITKLVRR